MSVAKHAIVTVSTIMAALVASSPVQAQEEFSVKLTEIQKIKSQEKSGDELYISVTEFPKTGSPRHYQVPSFPTHWLSSYLTSVKDVTLWQKNGQSCEEVKVIFSLVEEDMPPWNLDDLLGSVELNVTCEQGKPVSHWVIPNKANTEQLGTEKSDFSFTGDNSEYRAKFKFEQKVVTQVNEPNVKK